LMEDYNIVRPHTRIGELSRNLGDDD